MGFIKWLNQRLNPNHNWFDYDSWDTLRQGVKSGFAGGLQSFVADMPAQIDSVINQMTGAHLTGAQLEANDLQMQNAEDIYQRQVAGMQKAGLNPALMYGGASSAPEVSTSPGSGASLSDLLQSLALKSQIDLTKAQTRKTESEADTEKLKQEELSLVVKYYPQVQEKTIEEISSRAGLNLANIDKTKSEKALIDVQKLVEDKKNEYAERYYKALADYQEASTDAQKAKYAVDMANALMTGIEAKYAETYGARLSSSSALAILSAVTNVVDGTIGEVSRSLSEWIKNHAPKKSGLKDIAESVKNDLKNFKSDVIGDGWN